MNCVDVLWCAYQSINHFREPELPCMNFFKLLRVDAIPEFIWGIEKKIQNKEYHSSGFGYKVLNYDI